MVVASNKNERHCSCQIDILSNKLLENVGTLINVHQDIGHDTVGKGGLCDGTGTHSGMRLM